MKSKTGIVFSGGPAAGKSTVIAALEEQGYQVIHEIGTALMKEGVCVHPLEDRHTFQQEVLRRQLAAEAKFAASEKLCFLDRGLLDGMAHYIIEGLEVPRVFHELDLSHYAVVFLLEPLPTFVDNGIRYEEAGFAEKFGPVVAACYKQKNVPVVWVPVMSVEERLNFILAQVPKYTERQHDSSLR